MNADRRFAFQPPYRIRHTILGWNTQTQMHMVGHSMPLDQFDPHLRAKFPQDLADVLAERTKDCFLPIFRYDDDVVSAILPDMALIVPFAHCGFSFWWPWRAHNGRNHISLPESTPERQSLFESHRQRRWLTHWSQAGGPCRSTMRRATSSRWSASRHWNTSVSCTRVLRWAPTRSSAPERTTRA